MAYGDYVYVGTCYAAMGQTLTAMDTVMGHKFDEETMRAIAEAWRENRYLIDPHTAVAAGALRKYRQASGDGRVTVVASTASPYKFAPAVCEALGIGQDGDAYACIDALKNETGLPVPPQLAGLQGLPDRFTKVIEREEIADAVRAFMSE